MHSLIFTVFMSPEAAISTLWRTLYSYDYVKKNLALVAIDEAHCIIDWSAETM